MGTKTGKRGNCQCCGREFAVVLVCGEQRLSKHKAIAGDYYINTCPGSDFAPVQLDRAALDNTCSESLEAADGHSRTADRMRHGEALFVYVYAEEQKAHSMRLFSKRLEAMARVSHGKPLRDAER